MQVNVNKAVIMFFSSSSFELKMQVREMRHS